MNSRNTLFINNSGDLIIGGLKAKDLAAKYGTPLYVYDKKYIEDISTAYVKAINETYEGYGMVLYASKAFSCKGIYTIVNKLGLGADVVSGGELYTALNGGISANKLVMHGNNKLYHELEEAVLVGIRLIVCDSLGELEVLNEICHKHNKIQDILLRINPGVEAHTHHFVQTATPDSKFGFSISNGDALIAVKKATETKNLSLKGLHCHIGSQIFEKKSFELVVDKMTDFYKLLKENEGIEFDVLNLGGGFGIYYTDEDVKLSINDYTDYVKTITSKLNECIKLKNIKKPFLYLEPGRSIVGEAGVTLYTVGQIKEIKDMKTYIAVDGGMFDNPRFALYGSKYTVISATNGNARQEKTYTIAGKCCESGDIIAENCKLPKLNRGDLIAVLSTGAYNYSMASNYNRNTIPPVVIVEDCKSDYLVKPQSYEDIVRNDVIPEFIK